MSVVDRMSAVADGTLTGRSWFAPIAAAAILLLATAMIAVERVGLPEAYNRMAAGSLVVVVFALVGFRAWSNHLADWVYSSGKAGTSVTGAAISAAVLSGPLLVALPGLFLTNGGLGPVIMAAILGGVAASALLMGPGIAGGKTAALATMTGLRLGGWVQLPVAIAVIAASYLLLLAQLRAGIQLAQMFFQIEPRLSALVIATLLSLCVVPGGQFGILKTSLVGYAVITVLLLMPLVWLVTAGSSIPIPQLGIGYAAMEDLSSLEQQSRRLGIPWFSDTSVTGWPNVGEPMELLILFVIVAFGILAMPAFLSGYQSAGKAEDIRRSGIWTLALTAIVVTAAPAAAALTALGIYEYLIGLTTGEIGERASWAIDLGKQMAVTTAEPLLTICGGAVTSASALIESCGGNPDHAIGPADIRIHGELAVLGVAQINQLPPVLHLFAGTALFTGCLCAASAAAFAVIMAIPSRRGRDANSTPANAKLFVMRLLAVMVIWSAAFVALEVDASALSLMLWSLSVAASALAPLMIAVIWWRGLTQAGAGVGICTALFILIEGAMLAEFGGYDHFDLGPGFEVTGIDQLPVVLQTGILAFLGAVIALIVVSMIGGATTLPVAQLRGVHPTSQPGNA